MGIQVVIDLFLNYYCNDRIVIDSETFKLTSELFKELLKSGSFFTSKEMLIDFKEYFLD